MNYPESISKTWGVSEYFTVKSSFTEIIALLNPELNSVFESLSFCSLLDGYHRWPRLCHPACHHWCHPFCRCSDLFKIYGNQRDRCIHLFSVAPSAINCGFSFSVGLMTLTPRRGMGLRALTQSVKLILSSCSIYYSTGHWLPANVWMQAERVCSEKGHSLK